MSISTTMIYCIIIAILCAIQSEARRLAVDESISHYLQHEHANGEFDNQFTIMAVSPSNGGEIDLDVVEATSSITDTTTYSIDNGPKLPVHHSGTTVLVSDPKSSKLFTLIAVDESSGKVDGITQSNENGSILNIAQQPTHFIEGSLIEYTDFVTFSEATEFKQSGWECGVVDDHIHEDLKQDDDNIDDIFSANADNHERRLHAHDHKEHNHHQHHQHHQHHHHHHHHHEDTLEEMIGSIGSHISSGMRVLSTTDNTDEKSPWSYVVELYIEIDDEFVANTGGGDLDQAINYVNILMTGVSSIFEKEIDTHLHVQHIAKTNVYDATTTLTETYDLMVQTYANETGWHYQDEDIE